MPELVSTAFGYDITGHWPEMAELKKKRKIRKILLTTYQQTTVMFNL